MQYVEYALHNPSSRGNICEVKKLDNLRKSNPNIPIYRSVYFYDNDVIEHIRKTKSIKNYKGKRYIAVIPIDIDKGDNSDKTTLQKARDTANKLVNTYNLSVYSFRIYFSGRGYHIMINNKVFNFNPENDLPIKVEATMLALNLAPDKSVLRRSAIIRLEGSLNEKSNLFKIPLTIEELNTLEPEKIFELAKKRRTDFIFKKWEGNGELSDKKKEIMQIVENKNTNWNNNENAHLLNYPCIQNMLERGALEGTRNNTILRLASHLKWVGIPVDYAIILCNEWNKKGLSLDEKVIFEKVHYVYNTAIKYSCKDDILKFYCRPSCKEFKRMGEDSTPPLTNKERNEAFIDRLKLYDRKDDFINLKHILGLQHDCVLYPGELVAFLGDTGMNKTSILQNIAVGYNMETGKIQPHNQSILYYETELGEGLMQERFLSIVSGKTRYQLQKDLYKIHEYSKLFDNITLQTGLKTVQGIEEMIQIYQPSVTIIDYLEKILHPLRDKGMETQANAEIMRTLASMAQKYNRVIIVISAVNREGAKEGITVHSGKGTSAIEYSARRLFSIEGKQDDPFRKISMLKANNDRLFKNIIIERQNNWRFKKV